MTLKGFLLFDIDGVIRDVTQSYNLATQETVNHFINWRPTLKNIDDLKAEGCWNNDWETCKELIKRHENSEQFPNLIPRLDEITNIFNNFYFGGDPEKNDCEWKGFIRNENLLVNQDFFKSLTLKKVKWGFVSGAELSSAKFVLERRLGLSNPPLIAMGDAPDKPDPTGLIRLANELAGAPLGPSTPPIAYLGDTAADVLTIQNARKKVPDQIFISLAVAPPHLHNNQKGREKYEKNLRIKGADIIFKSTNEALEDIDRLFNYPKNQ